MVRARVCTVRRAAGVRGGGLNGGVVREILVGRVVADDETRALDCVVLLVDVKRGLAPTHVRGDGDGVRFLDPVLAGEADDGYVVRVRVFVRALDLHAIVVRAIADCAKHLVVDRFALVEHGDPSVFEGENTGTVGCVVVLLDDAV
jgi:hypothetical protein